jgi:CRISPR-associated protein Csx16
LKLPADAIQRDDVEIVAHASVEDLRGHIVIGTLPVQLAAECGEYWHLEIDVPAEYRGRELTIADMERFGCTLTCYTVQKCTTDASQHEESNQKG